MNTATDAHEALIEALGLTVRIKGEAVVNDVDLAVHAGEIVTLIGPNGSGKTTLVRAILGLVEPAQGAVRRRPGIRIGYVPQNMHVDETLPLTVRRFLQLAGSATGGRTASGRVAEALDEVGAAYVIDGPIQSISGGEKKRVLLAQALLGDPDLLVLDEPTAGVDVTGQEELYTLIREVRRGRGCGVLLVSHDLHLVMAATDRVVCLNHHVCCTGHPEAVSRHPEYLSLFGPEAAKALAVYTHDHDHRHRLSGEPVAAVAPGEEEAAAGAGAEHG
mgnify:CR=1 FL=1